MEAVQILLKSLEECNYDTTRLSWPHRLAVVYDFLCWLLFFGLRWIKSRLSDSNCTYKKHLSVVESAFTFSFSPFFWVQVYTEVSCILTTLYSNLLFSGRIPDSLRNCVNKEYFSASIGPVVNRLEQPQWASDLHSASNLPSQPTAVSHPETNGAPYRFPPVIPPVGIPPAAQPTVSDGPPDNVHPVRGPPSSIPGALVIPASGIAGRVSSASPVVNRLSPVQGPMISKADGDAPHKELWAVSRYFFLRKWSKALVESWLNDEQSVVRL